VGHRSCGPDRGGVSLVESSTFPVPRLWQSGRPVCWSAGQVGVGAHCWGSERSDPDAPFAPSSCVTSCWWWGVWAVFLVLARVLAPVGVGGSGVGLLFEIWIVDASIFVVCCVHCHIWFISFLVGWVGGVCDKL